MSPNPDHQKTATAIEQAESPPSPSSFRAERGNVVELWTRSRATATAPPSSASTNAGGR